MSITVAGRKMPVTDALRQYAEEKIGNSMKVMDIDPLVAEIVLFVEKNPANPRPACCEVTLRTKGHIIRVEECEEDMYAAIDVAAAKVVRQLRKYKTKVVDRKLRAADVKAYLEAFYADASYTHMVFPGMVFIAHPSELGTLYSLAELEELSALCRRYQIPLYLDGARLAYGLAAPDTDVTLADIARLADAFYIGGTKCGALCGEAVVFPRGGMPRHFLTHAKQHGALLAKGRLLGVQFDTLFTNNLYGEVGRVAIAAADELRRILREAGCTFFRESPTNQQFVVLENAQVEALAERIRFSTWEKLGDGRTVIRLVTSWSTTPDDLAALEAALHEVMQ